MRLVEILGRAGARLAYAVAGIEGVAKVLQLSVPGANPAILRAYGARVGRGCVLHSPLVIVNADGDLRRLTIGDDTHIGKLVLIDLAAEVVIGDRATVSMGVSIVTHFDVGASRLAQQGFTRATGAVRIEEDAYIGANATILHGVTVGRTSVIGAGAVVTRDVPPRAVVVGVPGKIARTIEPAVTGERR